jgi:hypothetical protein
MDPQRKSSDAGSASKPKSSRDVFSIREKLKILDMMGIEKHIGRGGCLVVWQEIIFHS